MNKKLIDLHIHSNYSDGRRNLEYIIDEVKNNNVGVLSLTEHYNLSSYVSIRGSLKNIAEVIPGIELGASLINYGLSKRHVCHILAYCPSNKIYRVLDEYELSRNKCVKQTLELLHKNGIELSYSTVKKSARNPESIGRFDIAIALCKSGHSTTPAKAYSYYLDEGCPIYIDREKMIVSDLIKNILDCGGVPVLAHPKSLRLNNSDFTSFISELKAFGLMGIEVYNPHNDKEQLEFYKSICEDFNLIATVGSDYHGRKNDETKIGLGIDNNLCISDYSIIHKLKKAKKSLNF